MHAAFLSSTAEYFHFWAFAAPTFVYGGVTVLWTLSIEEQFYLLWAPVVRFMREERLAWFLAAVIVGAPALRFWLHTAAFPEYRFFPARLDSLAWGAALALGMKYFSTDGQRVLRGCRWLGGLALVALAVLLATTGGRRENLWFATFGYSAAAAAFAALVGWTVMRARSDAWAATPVATGRVRGKGELHAIFGALSDAAVAGARHWNLGQPGGQPAGGGGFVAVAGGAAAQVQGPGDAGGGGRS